MPPGSFSSQPGGLFYPGINPGTPADRLRQHEQGSGGLIGPDGLQDPFTGAALADFISKCRECIGAPYLFWSAGGDGRHNQSVSEVLSNGESCSGIFVFAFLALGYTPPFSGTYDAKTALQAEGAETFDPSAEYPIGTFLVSTGGAEGHMAMVSAPGNQLIQALQSDGVTEDHTIADTLAMGGADLNFEIAGQFSMLGSATTLGSAAGSVGDWASWIAEGIANGLLRFAKALYAYIILRPLDFAGGFWWELTRRFLNYLKSNNVGSSWELPGADPTEEEIAAQAPAEPGTAFSEEDKRRIYFMLFLFVTYYLAFGRDKDGTHYFDKVAGGAGDLFNRDLWGKRTYNNRAKVRARVHHVTVARRRAKTTSRRTKVPGQRVAEAPRNAGTRDTGSARRGTGARDPRTGRFLKRDTRTGKETKENPQRQGEAARRENIEGAPERDTRQET
jgi:hypothetical protein